MASPVSMFLGLNACGVSGLTPFEGLMGYARLMASPVSMFLGLNACGVSGLTPFEGLMGYAV